MSFTLGHRNLTEEGQRFRAADVVEGSRHVERYAVLSAHGVVVGFSGTPVLELERSHLFPWNKNYFVKRSGLVSVSTTVARRRPFEGERKTKRRFDHRKFHLHVNFFPLPTAITGGCRGWRGVSCLLQLMWVNIYRDAVVSVNSFSKRRRRGRKQIKIEVMK